MFFEFSTFSTSTGLHTTIMDIFTYLWEKSYICVVADFTRHANAILQRLNAWNISCIFFWFTHVPNIQTSISSQFQHMRWKCDVKATHSHTLTRLFSFSHSLLFFNCLVLFSIWFLLVECWKAFLLSVKWWKSMCKSVK